MKLDEVIADVSSQLDAQAELGVQITQRNDVPETGPTNRGLWIRTPNVTAVFADLKGSTLLSAQSRRETMAVAYTYFVRAMAVILERFGSRYVDIQGDAVFGLFSGKQSEFLAAASAITMKTEIIRDVGPRFLQTTSSEWELTAGIGIDRGTLLVRRLGLRGTKQNEVWAGKPVNMASKLSSVADPNEVVVSHRVFRAYQEASKIRQRALLWSCGCQPETEGEGLDAPLGRTDQLWTEESAPDGLGLDFDNLYRLKSYWCCVHGPDFCEALIAGERPGD